MVVQPAKGEKACREVRVLRAVAPTREEFEELRARPPAAENKAEAVPAREGVGDDCQMERVYQIFYGYWFCDYRK